MKAFLLILMVGLLAGCEGDKGSGNKGQFLPLADENGWCTDKVAQSQSDLNLMSVEIINAKKHLDNRQSLGFCGSDPTNCEDFDLRMDEDRVKYIEKVNGEYAKLLDDTCGTVEKYSEGECLAAYDETESSTSADNVSKASMQATCEELKDTLESL